eukprot:TRINITY_DN16693_c0_g4_i1.p1 TRINITY_DN16693_c0_g4~~TRINITY_DN16693_c0_g4_i1.p1  ORF type:complete len:723 (+),score=75.71 TRINITY_DN16693_c0_g4_i1:74-2242(+)
MADRVHFFMELMLPELELLEQVGYFSTSELQQIRQKRENFEYALQRSTGRIEDYFRYIDYEQKLEKLRKIRKQKLKIKVSKERVAQADACIARRIHSIFSRLAHRYKAKVGVWKRWIDYCLETKSNKLLSKVFTRALKMHPNEPGFWIQAAAWEFEKQKNPKSARSLMLQAIRLCSNSKDVWVEYFRMELLYALKLIRRRKLLGIEVFTKRAEQADDDSDVVLKGQVALLAAKHGLRKFAQDVEFLRKMFQTFEPFRTSQILMENDSPGDNLDQQQTNEDGQQQLQKQILEEQNNQSIQSQSENGSQIQPTNSTRFVFVQIEDLLQNKLTELQNSGHFDAWQLRVETEILRGCDIAKVTEIYENALQKLRTKEIVDAYAGYLFQQLEFMKKEDRQDEIVSAQIQKLFQFAVEESLASEQLLGQWVLFLVGIQSSDEDIENAINKALEIYPQHIPVLLVQLQRFQSQQDSLNADKLNSYLLQIIQTFEQFSIDHDNQQYKNHVQELCFMWQTILKLLMSVNFSNQQSIRNLVQYKYHKNFIQRIKFSCADSEDDNDESYEDINQFQNGQELIKLVNKFNWVIFKGIQFWTSHGFHASNSATIILLVLFVCYFYGEDISLEIGEHLSHLPGTKQDFFDFILQQLQVVRFGENNSEQKVINKWFKIAVDRFGERNIDLWLNYAVYRQKELLGINDLVQDAKRHLHESLVEEFMSKLQFEMQQIMV